MQTCLSSKQCSNNKFMTIAKRGLLHTSNLPPLTIHIFRLKKLSPYNSVSSEHQHKLIIDGEKFQVSKFLKDYVMVFQIHVFGSVWKILFCKFGHIMIPLFRPLWKNIMVSINDVVLLRSSN